MRTGLRIYHSPTHAEQTVLHSATTPAIAVFEVDGRDHKVYCQVANLDCSQARLQAPARRVSILGLA